MASKCIVQKWALTLAPLPDRLENPEPLMKLVAIGFPYLTRSVPVDKALRIGTSRVGNLTP
jgi:hypothetical protein